MRTYRRTTVLFLVSLLYAGGFPQAADRVNRADFYDASGNHLMYVTFIYDENGKNTGRDVFMSDGTFKRRTVLVNNSYGNREKEVSFDFNDDTSFTTSIGKTDDRFRFNVVDQFKVDQFGGEINYKQSGADNFDFFQNGSLVNKISYKGKRVEISDASGKLYGYVLLDADPQAVAQNKKRSPSPISIQQRGANRFLLHLTLQSPSAVFCELISLSGKRVATIFSRSMAAGTFDESINMSTVLPGLASGVYLINMSIDGKRVYRDKILVNNPGRRF